MSFLRALGVSQKIFREFKNHKSSFGMIFIAPIITMLIFGVAFSGEVTDVDVVVVNSDQGIAIHGENISVSENVISNLDNVTLDIVYMNNLSEAIDKVENGEAYGVIFFPENFTKDVINNRNATILVRLDKSNLIVAESISKCVAYSVQEVHGNTTIKSGIITLEYEPIYGENAEFMDFYLPGVIGFVIYILTTMLTLVIFVMERTKGTLERLLATPLTEGEIVAGSIFAFSCFAIVQVALLLTVGILVFKTIIVGNLILVFCVAILLSIVCASIGLLLSSLARTEAQSPLFAPIIIIPAFLLSGVFWPIEAIPAWLKPVSYIIPLTYAVDALRSVILRGWGLEKIWIDIIALLAFLVFLLATTFLSLKRRK